MWPFRAGAGHPTISGSGSGDPFGSLDPDTVELAAEQQLPPLPEEYMDVEAIAKAQPHAAPKPVLGMDEKSYPSRQQIVPEPTRRKPLTDAFLAATAKKSRDPFGSRDEKVTGRDGKKYGRAYLPAAETNPTISQP